MISLGSSSSLIPSPRSTVNFVSILSDEHLRNEILGSLKISEIVRLAGTCGKIREIVLSVHQIYTKSMIDCIEIERNRTLSLGYPNSNANILKNKQVFAFRANQLIKDFCENSSLKELFQILDFASIHLFESLYDGLHEYRIISKNNPYLQLVASIAFALNSLDKESLYLKEVSKNCYPFFDVIDHQKKLMKSLDVYLNSGLYRASIKIASLFKRNTSNFCTYSENDVILHFAKSVVDNQAIETLICSVLKMVKSDLKDFALEILIVACVMSEGCDKLRDYVSLIGDVARKKEVCLKLINSVENRAEYHNIIKVLSCIKDDDNNFKYELLNSISPKKRWDYIAVWLSMPRGNVPFLSDVLNSYACDISEWVDHSLRQNDAQFIFSAMESKKLRHLRPLIAGRGFSSSLLSDKYKVAYDFLNKTISQHRNDEYYFNLQMVIIKALEKKDLQFARNILLNTSNIDFLRNFCIKLIQIEELDFAIELIEKIPQSDQKTALLAALSAALFNKGRFDDCLEIGVFFN